MNFLQQSVSEGAPNWAASLVLHTKSVLESVLSLPEEDFDFGSFLMPSATSKDFGTFPTPSIESVDFGSL